MQICGRGLKIAANDSADPFSEGSGISVRKVPVYSVRNGFTVAPLSDGDDRSATASRLEDCESEWFQPGSTNGDMSAAVKAHEVLVGNASVQVELNSGRTGEAVELRRIAGSLAFVHDMQLSGNGGCASRVGCSCQSQVMTLHRVKCSDRQHAEGLCS